MNPTELKDVKVRDIKDPTKSNNMYSEIKNALNEYVEYSSTGDMAFVIDDKTIVDMWHKHIKPYSDKIKPLTDELIALDEERAKMEEAYKQIIEKCESKKKEIDTLDLKRNKYITRISPMVIRKYQHKINEYQQFASIIEEDGTVFVVVKDWLASFISGFKKKADAHKEKVTDKITNNKIAA